jgi:hypothetical protein
VYIIQKHLNNFKKALLPGKAVIIYGARRTGKTTLVKRFLQDIDEPYLLVSRADIIVRGYLASQSIEKLSAFVGANRLLVVDEAQKEAIGSGLDA